MALPGNPIVWSPHTAADTLDASSSRPGTMSALQNLIPDPTTRDLWQCRPAAIPLVDFSVNATHSFSSGFSSGFGGIFSGGGGFISALLEVGTRIYGMVATQLNPGHDQPFCYDVVTQSFVPITGITAANTPTSPPTTGPWSPPSMALIGGQIIVAHPGFTQGNGFFGVITITNPFALTWTSQNTTGTPLVFPPTWVSNFNGRCFFLVNPPNAQPAAYMSDTLLPTVITNANQILTFGDNTPLTVSAGLALSNQLGGIIQALMIFKGVSNIFQVTGDYALGTLSINSLNVATGTFSPNSVVSSEKGLVFIAPDGVRLIDFEAHVSDPIGKDGDGVTVPFIFSQTPSRANGMFNSGVYRAQIQNGGLSGSPSQEWWYDFVRDLWSGPHTTNVSLGVPYQNTFIITRKNANGVLYQSDQVQSATSSFTEGGAAMSFVFATAMLPDTDQMSEVAMVESTIYMALASGLNITVSSVTPDGTVLDTVNVAGHGTPTLWGQFNWGQALWYGSQQDADGSNALFPRRLAWHAPLVFRRMMLLGLGSCVPGFKIGRTHLKYEVLGYLQEDLDVALSPSGLFTLDHSTLGGPDVLG